MAFLDQINLNVGFFKIYNREFNLLEGAQTPKANNTFGSIPGGGAWSKHLASTGHPSFGDKKF